VDAIQHPFAADRLVLRVGVATRAKTPGERKPSNLVFLVDVSGSMDEPDKLPLVKYSLKTLTENLSDHDTVALVTYAGDSRIILPRTSVDHRDQILAAIDHLAPGGSTAMASGLDTAYELAAANIKPGTISRVIVCTDGDANVARTASSSCCRSSKVERSKASRCRRSASAWATTRMRRWSSSPTRATATTTTSTRPTWRSACSRIS